MDQYKGLLGSYANTGNLPIAIVNRDEGMMLRGKYTNVGNGIVENLKGNKTWAGFL